ncbi:mucin-5B-like [Argopecten irradians]|uniref:mucin-5B-like n=1 Tax=Argopecten irradians TaxID=31199 RepID=UPI0037106178
MEGITQDPTQSGIQYKEALYSSIDTVFFDGLNSVDVNVGPHSFEERDDYTFTFYMKPSNIVVRDRCLMHYQSTGGTTSVKMVLHQGTDLHIYRTLNTGASESLYFTGTVQTNQWQLFAVAVDNSMGKIAVIVLSVVKEELIGEKKQAFQTPGVLRIGGCFDNSFPSYTGSVTCLSLFDDKLHESDLHDVDEACEESTYVCYASTPTLTTILNSATCPSTPSTVTSTPSTVTSTPSTVTSTPSTVTSTLSTVTSTPSTTLSTVTSTPSTVTSTLSTVTSTPSTVTSTLSTVTSTPSTVTSTPSTETSTLSTVTSTPSTVTSTPSTETSTPFTVTSTPSSVISTESPLHPPLYFTAVMYIGNDVTLVEYVMTQDLVPNPDLHLYVAAYPDVSLLQCGSSCMMDMTCKSFSIEELSDGLGTCRIYNIIITTHVSLSLSGYYMKQ